MSWTEDCADGNEGMIFQDTTNASQKIRDLRGIHRNMSESYKNYLFDQEPGKIS